VNPAIVQTLWADVIACTLRDAGVSPIVISPGSRSTPLVAALVRAKTPLVTIIDERAAAFYALGAARATGKPAALVCTSGSAAAHYLPAIVEAAHAGVPLIAITADRPPELHACGASQTIDQHAIYGGFTRGAFELGAPAADALRAVRRTMIQAITRSLGPDPGPVHINVPLRKPLEPAQPTTAEERALVAELPRPSIAPPVLAPDPAAIDSLASAIAAEPRGLIVAGALPAEFARARESVFELARRSGYPIVAEAGSQLRLCARPDDVTVVDAFDIIAGFAPRPALIIQLGSEPVAAAWPAFLASSRDAARHVLAGPRWHDAGSTAASVILADTAHAVRDLAAELAIAARTKASSLRRQIERDAASLAWRDDWRTLDQHGREALDRATREFPATEVSAMRDALAALPAGCSLQIGNSLPIRVVDHATLFSPRDLGALRSGPIDLDSRDLDNTVVLTQRGAAGIDGLIASAAGATQAGRPVLLVLGDVSFAHDVGGLLAARAAVAPLAILVIDNGGGRIFDGLPIAKANLGDTFETHWTTPPAVDVVAVARALGVAALAASPETIAYDVATACSTEHVTVIHAAVSPFGAREVRTRAIELASAPRARASAITRSSVPVIARTGEMP